MNKVVNDLWGVQIVWQILIELKTSFPNSLYIETVNVNT